MGISILVDTLMEAIEVMTSKYELVHIPDQDGNMIYVEKLFWNPTVANLTLMAIATSSPQILLSIADTCNTVGELPTELGPQAIIGSASFSLLVTSAFSIMSVTEVKKIDLLGVFWTTALFQTWAFVWFFLVLVVFSPGIIEIWEALATPAFIVVLWIAGYICDKCHKKG